MDMIFLVLSIGLAVALIIIYAQSVRIRRLEKHFKAERDTKMSLAVKHGMTMEHLVPWSSQFPGDPRTFRFIGDPVDGILFGKDKITFMEFKTGNSQLSEKQKRIRELVRQKRIEWNEVRM